MVSLAHDGAVCRDVYKHIARVAHRVRVEQRRSKQGWWTCNMCRGKSFDMSRFSSTGDKKEDERRKGSVIP